MTTFRHESGNWVSYRSRFGLTAGDEIDFHFEGQKRSVDYWEAMQAIEETVERSLRKAQESGRPYVMFVHGWSTSGPFKTTARSVVRGFMRSKKATPLIERKHCIQHETVFVTKIRCRRT
jgi:hypothetical protein